VDVQHERPGTRCGIERGEDDRGARGHRLQLHREPTLLEHRLQLFGVTAHVGVVARDVRNRQQRDEFVDDLALVLRGPCRDWRLSSQRPRHREHKNDEACGNVP
jgi:hypothetical protein